VDDPREPATVDLGSNDNLELFPDPLDVLSRPRIRERTTRLAPRPIRSPTRAEPEKLSDTGFQFPPPPTPRNRPRPNATATPLVGGYKHCIMPPKAPTPIPQARRPTGRPTRMRVRYCVGPGLVAALGPLRHTLAPTNAIGTCIRVGSTVWATGQGWLGSRRSNQQVRQKHWPIPRVGTPAILRSSYVFRCMWGAARGGPAPTSSSDLEG